MAVWKVKETTKFYEEHNIVVVFNKDTRLQVFDSKFKYSPLGAKEHYWKVGELSSPNRYWILDEYIKSMCEYLRS